jgi:hypothetical protein
VSRSAHNKMTNEFVNTLVRKVVTEGGASAELTVVLESITLAIMLTNIKMFHVTPQAATEMAESAMLRSIERLTDQMKPR